MTSRALRRVSSPPEGFLRSQAETTSAPDTPLGGRRLRDLEMEDEEDKSDLGDQVDRALKRLVGEGSEGEVVERAPSVGTPSLVEASPTTGSRISSFVFTEKSFSSGSSASESSAPPSALDAPALDNALRIPSPANYPVYKDLLSTGTALHPTVAGETDDNPFLYRPPSLPLTPTAYSFPSSTLTADHFSQPEPTPPPASDSLPRQSTPPQATSDSPALLAGNSFISSEIFELYESLPPLSRVSNRTKVGEVDLREKQDPENESEDDQKSTELDERPATGSSVVVYSLGDGEQRFERRIRELEERATRAEQGFRELEVERDKRGDGIEEMLDGLGINVATQSPIFLSPAIARLSECPHCRRKLPKEEQQGDAWRTEHWACLPFVTEVVALAQA